MRPEMVKNIGQLLQVARDRTAGMEGDFQRTSERQNNF